MPDGTFRNKTGGSALALWNVRKLMEHGGFVGNEY